MGWWKIFCRGQHSGKEMREFQHPYLRKGQGCAQWSGSPLLPPGELALPLDPMADTPEYDTDTSSAAEHPLCSSTDGSTCQVGVWVKRVRTIWEMGSSPEVLQPHPGPLGCSLVANGEEPSLAV